MTSLMTSLSRNKSTEKKFQKIRTGRVGKIENWVSSELQYILQCFVLSEMFFLQNRDRIIALYSYGHVTGPSRDSGYVRVLL